ncbi:MAG: dTDP-4-dehydrorhamnose 3,5-epimerase family protein [Planctomycetaceae bacterium]|jgi:dTDP-4-dehydrorhamnose 3,5-epimerase|nr:dTDP-4-dehydrorhamnose 3,5-epimerase family protein [Planctomycetaceae bacterium]
MQFTPLLQSGAYRIDLDPRGDERGQFTRLLCANELKKIGLTKPIVNINHSRTREKGTIRGMHFQYPPDCEIKIIKCIRGAVWDCIVDIRNDSPTFLKWDAVELTAENNRMIYVPEGFAHGFQTLTNDAEIVYFVTAFYAPKNEDGLRFDDPDLRIDWQLQAATVSERDKKHPLIAEKRDWKGITLV